MEAQGGEKKKKTERKLSMWYIFGGGILKEDFVLRHTRMIVLLVVLAFFFIGNRYTCMQKLREIDRLNQRLRDVRFEALSISSELTGHSRQSQIEALIEEQGIDLEVAKNPSYVLQKKKKKGTCELWSKRTNRTQWIPRISGCCPIISWWCSCWVW